MKSILHVGLPILAVLLALFPTAASGQRILNEQTRTPPCTPGYPFTYPWTLPIYISLGLDSGEAIATCPDPVSGVAHPFARTQISSTWPSAANQARSTATAYMGIDGFLPERTGLYEFDFDITLVGQAGIRVPWPPGTWGGADGYLYVLLAGNIHQSVPLAPIRIARTEYPLVNQVRMNSGEDSWTWASPNLHLVVGPVTLQSDSPFPYCAQLMLACYAEANTVGTSGGATAWTDWRYPEQGGGCYLNSVTVRNLDPDTTRPTVSMNAYSVLPGEYCRSTADPAPVWLEASDDGGFGVQTIYYRLDGSGTLVYTPGFLIGIAPGTHQLEYWAVDRVGLESEHLIGDYVIRIPPAAPATVSPADGSSVVMPSVWFDWEGVVFADSYELEVDDNADFSSPLGTWYPSTDEFEATPSESGSLHWRVRGHNEVCDTWGAWSLPCNFEYHYVTGVGGHPRGAVPSRVVLEQNHPNPFNPRTTIVFGLPWDERAVVEVFSARGILVKRLADASFDAGYHELTWDGTDDDGRTVASGVYVCRVRARDTMQTEKMTLVR